MVSRLRFVLLLALAGCGSSRSPLPLSDSGTDAAEAHPSQDGNGDAEAAPDGRDAGVDLANDGVAAEDAPASDGAGGSGGGGQPDGGAAGAGGSDAGAGGAGGRGTQGGASGAGGASDAATTFGPWPGSANVTVVDQADFFGIDLSGLVYEPGATLDLDRLWAVQNGTAKLFLLASTGGLFAPVADAAWSAGKLLHFPKGDGTPDAEGLTEAEWATGFIYVSTERDNEVKNTSRMSVLRFDTSVDGTALTATHEWNLTKDLPTSDPNKGLEGVTWVPDSYLTAKGFYDENLHKAYDPSAYGGHGTGIFFVGLESNGFIYGYALNHNDGSFQRVATFDGGQGTLVDLTFDRDNGTLWSYCDDACGNRAVLFDIDTTVGSPTQGHFIRHAGFNRPAGLPNAGNEGITFAPESECLQGSKAFYWSDDSDTNSHALRQGTLPCGRL